MIVEATSRRDRQKAGSAGGTPWEAASRACTESPSPQEDLDFHYYVACCGVGKRRGSAVSSPPRAHPGAKSGGVWVRGMPVRRGEGRQAFCPDFGITLLHRKSREKIRLSPGLM